MRVLVALIAFVAVAALNLLWWWWPNRPVEIAGWTNAPLQSVSFAPYRPGQSPLTRTFPTPDQIEEDLRRLQGKVRAVRTYSAGENLETVPQRAGKYGLKVWHGAWLNDNDKENLEQVNLLIDHANKYKDTVERVIVGNEVLLRKELTANQLRRYIRQVKQRVSQPVTYADVWEFWMRNPSLADEVDFITIHILPYWEDVPIGLDRREPDGKPTIEKHIVDIYKKVQERFPGKTIVIGETGWPSDGRMRSDARPGRVEQVRYFSIFRSHRRPREVRLQHRRSLRPVLEGPPGRHGRRRLGPARRPAPRQVRARQAGVGRAALADPVHPVDAGRRPDAGRLRRDAPPGARQGDRDLRRLRPARRHLLRAGDLDRPVAHLLLREDGRRGLLGRPAGALQLRPAARHRRQPDRQDGRSLALRRAGARGVARLARAAALSHPAARRPDAAGSLPRADGALHLLPDRHQHRLVRRRDPHRRDLVPPDRHRRPLPRFPDLELRHPDRSC